MIKSYCWLIYRSESREQRNPPWGSSSSKCKKSKVMMAAMYSSEVKKRNLAGSKSKKKKNRQSQRQSQRKNQSKPSTRSRKYKQIPQMTQLSKKSTINLETIFTEIKEGSSKVNDSLKNLGTMMEQNNAILLGLSQQLTEVVRGIQKSASAIQKVAEGIEKSASAIQKAAEGIEKSASKMENYSQALCKAKLKSNEQYKIEKKEDPNGKENNDA